MITRANFSRIQRHWIFKIAFSALCLVAAFGIVSSTYAASGAWVASPTDANWNTVTNWSTATTFPGTINWTGNANQADIATFNTPIFNNGTTNIGDSTNPIV